MIALPRVSPGSGVVAAAGQVWATVRAEITMQWRRWGLWVAFGCVTALLVLITVPSAVYLLHPPPTSLYARQHYTPADLDNLMTFSTTEYAAIFLGLVAALLVVDRLGRDQRLGMVELQRAAPQGPARYLLGKFLGNYLAVLILSLMSYLFCALITLPLGWPVVLLAKFLLAFLLVFVPASLAAVGLALLLASFLPLRVVQVGFSLLWIEFSIGPGWHALVFTIFNPSGLYVYPLFFPTPPMQYAEPGFQTSLSLALLNMAVLLLVALVALLLTYGSLVFQRHRQEGA
jgi:ABC-type transport system involved in multi-copper enzyme maturation permease subunit